MVNFYYAAFVVVAILLLEIIGRRYHHEEVEKIDDPEKKKESRLSFVRFYIEYSFTTIGVGALFVAGILRWYGYSESYIYLHGGLIVILIGIVVRSSFYFITGK